MSDDAILPPISTRVAHAPWGDNDFRGFSVRAELAGHTSLWSILSLCVGGPPVDDTTSKVLDDITTAGLSADPRIWPMKLARLGSSYGFTIAGLGAALLALERAPVGGRATGIAARFLIDLDERLRSGASLVEELERLRASGHRFPGFGAPFRDEDERVVVLTSCIERYPRAANGHHWRLVRAVDAHMASAHRLPINICGATAALLLDLGFDVEQVSTLGVLLLLPNFLANAYEGAQQRPAVLQRLPDHVIDYQGHPPRRSPRARAAAPDASETAPDER